MTARRLLLALWIGFASIGLALLPRSESDTPNALLLETDADGRVVHGSVEAVLDAVRDGRSLRVGWELLFQMPDADEPLRLEHWTCLLYTSPSPRDPE